MRLSGGSSTVCCPRRLLCSSFAVSSARSTVSACRTGTHCIAVATSASAFAAFAHIAVTSAQVHRVAVLVGARLLVQVTPVSSAGIDQVFLCQVETSRACSCRADTGNCALQASSRTSPVVVSSQVQSMRASGHLAVSGRPHRTLCTCNPSTHRSRNPCHLALARRHPSVIPCIPIIVPASFLVFSIGRSSGLSVCTLQLDTSIVCSVSSSVFVASMTLFLVLIFNSRRFSCSMIPPGKSRGRSLGVILVPLHHASPFMRADRTILVMLQVLLSSMFQLRWDLATESNRPGYPTSINSSKSSSTLPAMLRQRTLAPPIVLRLS